MRPTLTILDATRVLIRNGPAGPDIQVSGGTVWLDEQTLPATGTFSARVGAGKQIVLPTNRHCAQRALSGIIVDL